MNRRRFLGVGVTVGIGAIAGCSRSIPVIGSDDSGPSGDAPGGLVVPDDFRHSNTQSVQDEGGETTVATYVYTGSGTRADAVDAWRQSAEDAGWNEKGTKAIMDGEYSGVVYEKGDEAILIQASGSGDNVAVTVVHGPTDIEDGSGTPEPGDGTDDGSTGDGEQPPATDVEGSDLSDVPRYPGSVRTSHSVLEQDTKRITVIEYETQATIDEVQDYYQQTLPDHGWTIGTTWISDGDGFLNATSGDLAVEIGLDRGGNYDGYTTIVIKHTDPSGA